MAIFLEIAVILVLTTVVCFLLRAMKQPLIVGYILTGILVGPSVLNLIHHHETLELFSQFGIVTLLFLVGLHLSPKVISEVGKTSLILGLSQIVFTSIVGFGISLLFGWGPLQAILIAVCMTFSSTIIVLKLLTDKREVHSLHGRVAIGFLLVQDIVASLILIFFGALAGSSGQPGWFVAAFFVVRVLIVAALYWLSVKLILPSAIKVAAKSSELLFLFSLTWTITYAAIFYFMGLSVEIGALIAGISLSSSPFAEEIASRLTPLRDFFITLFFIVLGSNMVLAGSGHLVLPALIFSLFVLIGNPMIVMILMNLLGYQRRTGFLAGLTVAQISEFSLILATMASKAGLVDQATLTMLTIVGLITITGSTYFMLYSEKIYSFISPWLKLIEFKKNNIDQDHPGDRFDVLLFGYKQNGAAIVDFFIQQGRSIAVIDFDPDVTPLLEVKNVKHFYGDAGDVEFLQTLPFETSKLVVSALSTHDSATLLTKHSQARNPRLITIVFSTAPERMSEYYDAGATYVISPHHYGAMHLATVMTRFGFIKAIFQQQSYLHRQELARYIS